MSHNRIENFNINSPLPIDSRFVSSDHTTIEFPYVGLIVYNTTDDTYYKCSNVTPPVWVVFPDQSSGGGTDLNNVLNTHIPYKTGNSLGTSAMSTFTTVGNYIPDSTVFIQDIRINTRARLGTITIGSSQAPAIRKTMVINQDNQKSSIGINHNYIQNTTITQSLASMEIGMSNNSMTLSYRKPNLTTSAMVPFLTKNSDTTVFHDNSWTYKANKSNRIFIYMDNNVMYRDTHLSGGGFILDAATYDTSNNVNSVSKFYRRASEYSLLNNYNAFVISETHNLINSSIITRFQNQEVIIKDRGGIVINGNLDKDALIVSSTYANRNIISIKPPTTNIATSGFGPGIIVDANRPNSTGFYVGQYYNDGSLRILRSDNITSSSSDYYFMFEQNGQIRANIPTSATTDTILSINSDLKLATKSLLEYTRDPKYLADSTYSGTIDSNQYDLINQIPEILDDIEDLQDGAGSGTVTSVGVSVMNNALVVSPAEITNSGIFNFTWGGTSSDYVRGNGTIGQLPNYTLTQVGVSGSGFVSGNINLIPGNNIDIQQSGNNFTISSSGGGGEYTAGSGISITNNTITNTRANQTLSLTGNTLSISAGNSVNLPQVMTRIGASGGSFLTGDITISGSGNISVNQTGQTITISSSGTSATATASILGVSRLYSNTVQSAEANPVSAINSRTYGVQFNANEQLVTNVPWIETRVGVNSGNYTSGNINLLAGTGITLTKSGNNIAIGSSGGSGALTKIRTNATGYTNATDNYLVDFIFNDPSAMHSDQMLGNMVATVDQSPNSGGVKFYGSYDTVKTVFIGGDGNPSSVNIDGATWNNPHILNVMIRDSSSGGHMTIELADGFYSGDQVNIVANVKANTTFDLLGKIVVDGALAFPTTQLKVYRLVFINLLWDSVENCWVTTAYNYAAQ